MGSRKSARWASTWHVAGGGLGALCVGGAPQPWLALEEYISCRLVGQLGKAKWGNRSE